MRHLNMAAWSPEEDRIILDMFETSGRKWGKIAAELSSRPGGGTRTSASVRNRYLRIEKGQAMRAEGKSKNRCAACGLQKLGHVCQARLNAAKPASFKATVDPPALIAPVANGEAAEALASLSSATTTPAPKAAADGAPSAWHMPRKLMAWRKHEEEDAARRMSFVPGAETKPEVMAPERREPELRESEMMSTPKLQLAGAGNVVVLTKRPSGEVLVSMFSMAPEKTAAALAAAAL